ncbi:hypothetical protein [Aminobacterium colombiense]|uniref:hypothetical protein n=1 Tax=Aminobacterium colombiense TaxID=81468 RepID=UPI002593340E|nr:hypothetical protein [uncultured Aminobacterium sp.]
MTGRSRAFLNFCRNENGWVFLKTCAWLGLVLLIAAGVVSYGPLLFVKAEAQRDLDNATRAAVMQIDMEKLRIGEVIWLEDEVEEMFDQKMREYSLQSKVLTLNPANYSLHSEVSIIINFRPFFVGQPRELVMPRESTAQLFWAADD